MDRKGRNYDQEEIPGSGRSIRGYILTYSELSKGEHLSALGSQQAVLVGGWYFCVRSPRLRV